MTHQEAIEFWAAYPVKTWVVKLKTGRVMYVRARNKNRAVACAKVNRFEPGRFLVDDVRLATPSDLGCVERAA